MMVNFSYDERWNARCDPPPLTIHQKIAWAVVITLFTIICYIFFAFYSSQHVINEHVCSIRQLVIITWQFLSNFTNLIIALAHVPKTTNDWITLCMFDVLINVVAASMFAIYLIGFGIIALLEGHLFILSCLVNN